MISKRALWWFFAMAGPFLLYSCNVIDYNEVGLYSDAHQIQAVVEIPAGSNQFIEYCALTRRFNIMSVSDEGYSKRTLPFPFNIGFIPSTMQADNSESSGPAIDVIIVSEPLQTGKIIEILPIGLVSLRKEFDTRQWIVAVPYDESLRIISAKNLQELSSRYSGIMKIIEEWLCYSDPDQKTDILSWQDEILAVKFIESVALN